MRVYKVHKKQLVVTILSILIDVTAILLAIFLENSYYSGMAGGFLIGVFFMQITHISETNVERPPIESINIDGEEEKNA